VKRGLVVAIVCAAAGTAHAHKPSDAHLRLEAVADGDATLRGRLDVALRDLDAAIGLDADGNGDITWGEVTAAAPKILAYVQPRIGVAGDGQPCAIVFGTAALTDLVDGAYWSGPLTVTCPTRPAELAITYNLLFDLDAQHRGLVHLAGTIAVVRDATPVKLPMPVALSHTLPVLAGARAAGTGLDHLLILALAIVPIGAWRRRARAAVARAPRISAEEVGRRIGAFVIGQLIVCALVAWGQLAMPSDVIELAIAMTTAAAIVYVAFGGALRWTLALELGALHGFSLAAALAHLARPPATPARTLIGFSLGAALAYAAIAAGLYAAERALTPRPET
jgi:hypothetical protein